MKTLLVLLASCLASAPLCALEVTANSFVLSPDDIAACEAEGGCAVVSRARFEKAVPNRVAEALKACRNQT